MGGGRFFVYLVVIVLGPGCLLEGFLLYFLGFGYFFGGVLLFFWGLGRSLGCLVVCSLGLGFFWGSSRAAALLSWAPALGAGFLVGYARYILGFGYFFGGAGRLFSGGLLVSVLGCGYSLAGFELYILGFGSFFGGALLYILRFASVLGGFFGVWLGWSPPLRCRPRWTTAPWGWKRWRRPAWGTRCS